MKDGFYVVYDFDTSLYASSTVLEDSYIIARHISSGREKEFKNITEFKGKGRTAATLGGWLKEENDERGTDFKASDFKIIQKKRRNSVPFSKAQEFIISSAECVREKPWCDKIRYVIGGEDNYRLKLNPLYKDGRPPKPIMYQELREWFIETYKDEVIIADGCEADDILSIFGHYGFSKALKSGDYKDDKICLVFIDKDLLQIPGWKWNFKSKKENPDWQTPFMATKSLFVQLLQGDPTDNIKGLEGVPKYTKEEYKLKGSGIGNTNALTLLSDCDTKEKVEERVKYLYRTYYCDLWEEKFQESYQMLKLMDKKGEIPKYEFLDKV